MALGHALLHPGRIREALNTDAFGDGMAAGGDIALGMAGFGDPGAAANAWVKGVVERLKPFGDKLAAIAEKGPFAAFMQPLLQGADALQQRFGPILEALASLDGDELRRTLTALLDDVLAILPDLRMASLRDIARTEINAALGILEQPLLSGRRDAAAHRSFRTAAEIRRRIAPLEQELPPGVGTIDLKVVLRDQILSVLNGLDASGLKAVKDQLASFRTEFGPLLSALSRLSVRVDVQAGGPQRMAKGNPDFTDERKVTPFPRGDAIWVVDLLTGVFACFNLFWELLRTRNFSGRWLDGIASLLLLIWQTVRMTVRIGWPDELSDAESGTQWLFSDQGDFVLSVGLRWLMAFHEAGTAQNYVASVLVRALKHVTAVSQPRWIYQWVRAIWYLDSWSKAPEATRGKPEFLRILWSAWGPMWAATSIGGLIPPWDDFHLEGVPGSMLASLIVSGILGIGGAVLALSTQADWTAPAPDTATRIIMSAFAGLAIILTFILVGGIETDDKGLTIGLLIGATIILLALFIGSFADQESGAASYILIFLTGVFCAALVPFVLWWLYIDDGRDKTDAFKGLNVANSPYRLPFPRGESWMCSQGTHGIFSHHSFDRDATDNKKINESNQFAYDFNESEGKQAVAARDGIVIGVTDHNPNREEDANFIEVMHLDWAPGHDAGTEDERQINIANYYHVMQHSIGPTLNQPIVQGQPLALIDSTGASAQHHIHIDIEEHQRKGDTTKRPLRRTLPFVFKDDSSKKARAYPLLAWIGGKGNIDGKPIAYAFYESDNATPTSPPLVALEFSLAEPSSGDGHIHRVVLPAAMVAGNGDATVMADPSLGHTHEITVPRAMINDLMHAASSWGSSVVVAPGPDGHTHPALRFAAMTLRLHLKEATGTATKKHEHTVDVDLTQLLDGPLTAQTFKSSFHSVTAGAPPPRHDVTLQPAGLLKMLRRQAPASADVTVTNSDAHTHAVSDKAPGRDLRSLPSFAPSLRAPPRARLNAETPGPYRLMGEQTPLRVNNRATEAWLFGAHRATLIADVPAERGLSKAEQLQFSAATLSPPKESRASPRIAARELTNVLRTSGAPSVHSAVIATPVLVIETRQRGSAASLSLGASSPIFGAAGPISRGAGDLPDIQSFTPNALAGLVDRFLKNGWPKAPAGTLTAFNAGGLVIDHAPSAPRTQAVLTRSINTTNNSLFPANALPLQPGFVGVTAGFSAPILAAPAVHTLDLTAPAMTGAARAATPLVVTLNGAPQSVTFRASDADAAAVARRIMLEADGVRAIPAGANSVTVSTIAGGSDIVLALDKAGGTALATGNANGVSANLPGRIGVSDTGAVLPGVLRNVVADAAARNVLPYDAAVVKPEAILDGGRLRLSVAAGQIRLAAQGLVLVPGADAAAAVWRSDALPAPMTLAGSSWLDVEVDGATIRIPVTGEPARLEVGPLPRLPADREFLVLNVGVTAVRIEFDGKDADIFAVAARIAAASDLYSVRFAWRMELACTLHGDASGPSPLTLGESLGLGMLGFLRDRTLLTNLPEGAFSDHLATGPDAPIRERNASPGIRKRLAGPVSSDLTVPVGDPPMLEGPAGQNLTVAAQIGTDVLAFAAPSSNQARVGVPLPFALARGCVTWDFTLRQGATVRARAIGQLSAMPAALRATKPPAVQGAVTVTVTIFDDVTASPPATIDLAGVKDAADACDRLLRCPGLTAFPVTLDDGSIVVHLETAARGTKWRLRLNGRNGILALGFRRPQFNIAGDVLEVRGGGTVANAVAVTADEVRAMLARAAATATGPEDTPPLYDLAPSPAGGLILTPSGPALSLGSQPLNAFATLGATPGPGGILTLPPGSVSPGPALVQVIAGPQHTTLPVLGRVAVLRAADPPPADGTADATTTLAFLQANGLDVQVDGVARRVPPSPGAFPTVNDAVEWINRHIAPGWAGLVPEPATGAPPHLVLRGARRGSAGAIAVNFPAAPPLPAIGVLGLTAAANASGAGTFQDTDSITVAGGAGTLQALLADRADNPDAPQALYRAAGDDTAGTLELLPAGVGLIIREPAPVSSLGFAVSGNGLKATPGAARALDPELVKFTATRASQEDRLITAPLWGRAARLPSLGLPANLAVLATRQLQLEAEGTAFTVTFTAPADAAAMCAQIARATNWTVRAFIATGGLVLESLIEGTASRLKLLGGSAVTNDPSTGVVSPTAPPFEVTGTGSVPNMAKATPTDLVNALQAAWTEADQTSDRTLVLDHHLHGTAYGADAVTGSGWYIGSLRRGVAGRLEFIAAAGVGTPIDWDESLSRGAAERAAIALPAIAATVAPNGNLPIGLDENTSADLPAPRTINVAFDGTALNASQIAARINAALRAAGAGAAAAWPDGRVVIETAAPGLAGSVRIPANGAPRGASDILLQGGGDLFARGWPGAGRAAQLAEMTAGWRGVRATAKEDRKYTFKTAGVAGAAGVTVGPIDITANMGPDTAAGLINTAFDSARSGGTARIGLAGVVDGALCVEAIDPAMTFEVDGKVPATSPATKPGTSPELIPDKAFDMRRTDWVRTVRLTLAAANEPLFAPARDLGYLRPPVNVDSAKPDVWESFPVGRWLVAMRPDAARSGESTDESALRHATAMVIASMPDEGPERRALPMILRYWPDFKTGSLLGASSAGAEPFLVDFITWPQ